MKTVARNSDTKSRFLSGLFPFLSIFYSFNVDRKYKILVSCISNIHITGIHAFFSFKNTENNQWIFTLYSYCKQLCGYLSKSCNGITSNKQVMNFLFYFIDDEFSQFFSSVLTLKTASATKHELQLKVKWKIKDKWFSQGNWN